MILPINIDLSDLVEEFSLTANQTEILGTSIIDKVIVEYSTRWEDLVNRELKNLDLNINVQCSWNDLLVWRLFLV